MLLGAVCLEVPLHPQDAGHPIAWIVVPLDEGPLPRAPTGLCRPVAVVPRWLTDVGLAAIAAARSRNAS